MRDGLIQSNDAFTDTMALPRQIGMMPPQGSAAEQRMTSAFNAKTRLTGRMLAEPRAGRRGRVGRAGQPGRCNVYLIEDDGGVTLFDAGARTMTRAVATAAPSSAASAAWCSATATPTTAAPRPRWARRCCCHPDEVEDAEGSGGFRYWPEGLAGLPTPQRQIHRVLHRFAWDGGPVKIAGTVERGRRGRGLPRRSTSPATPPARSRCGASPTAWRWSATASTRVDMWGRDCEPQLPDAVYNFDTEQARASLRKLAALEPAAAWPGHAKPVTGDVRAQLERAPPT